MEHLCLCSDQKLVIHGVSKTNVLRKGILVDHVPKAELLGLHYCLHGFTCIPILFYMQDGLIGNENLKKNLRFY